MTWDWHFLIYLFQPSFPQLQVTLLLSVVDLNVVLSFILPCTVVLSNVSGFVKKGGITAVFGASSAGKSLLLQALSGRIHDMTITGDMYIDGLPKVPTDISNSISYVSQNDMLIGDLTAKEMITTAATLKNCAPENVITKDVNDVLTSFGIDHVKDTFIGTIFRAGLSGGQKRRVDVGIEMVAPPSVLLLDEPTSGLDGSIAYDVLKAIRDKVTASEDKLSVMVSIHQPNSRVLSLFDHILVLGAGNMTFFGTVEESVAYFTEIGAPPPLKYTPTDFYLQITDTNFSTDKVFDFEGAFVCSKNHFALVELLDQVRMTGVAHRLRKVMGGVKKEKPDSPPRVSPRIELTPDQERAESAHLVDNIGNSTSFATQYVTLLQREWTIAKRDYTLYYLQCVLVTVYGILMGAVFFQLKYKIDESLYYVPGGLLWLCLMMIYIQIFKVYHLNKANVRFRHEYANNDYSVFAAWCAEFTISVLGIATYMPGAAIAYFMMGMPAQAFGFMLVLLWSVSCCSFIM